MTKKETQLVKGVAICLLLFHHLYQSATPSFGIMIGEEYLTNIVAEQFKVCVAIFLLLSGYGLNSSMNHNHYSPIEFYKRNILKILKNLWLIWFIFIPIGLLRGKSFTSIYGDNYVLPLLIDFLGLARLFGTPSYNPTWWFISLILGLYLIFPILYKWVKRFPISIFLLSVCLMLFVKKEPLPYLKLVNTYRFWVLPFVCGIILSEYDLIQKTRDLLKKHGFIKATLYFGMLVCAIYLRMNSQYFGTIKIDSLFALAIVFISVDYLAKIPVLNQILDYIGSHSFNIFLFHTFIYGMYLRKFIFSFKHPFIIWLVLLLTCLIISVMLENLKNFLSKTKTSIYQKMNIVITK